MSTSNPRFDDTVHQQSRLSILAALVEGGEMTFTTLREVVELTDGNLSRHVQILEDAGFVRVKKGRDSRRPRTWVSVTREGKRAFDTELSVLRSLIDRIDRGGNSAAVVAGKGARTSSRPILVRPASGTLPALS